MHARFFRRHRSTTDAQAVPTTRTPPSTEAGLQPETGTTSTELIVRSITTAIVERRLMPGTKLVEQQIADIFKVSRTLVRQALNQLSRDKLVTLSPARGAFVAEPSAEEARQIFELRQMIETAMIRRIAETITPVQVAQLRAHLKEEAAAVARTDVPGRTRLLADFHTLLARMLGNEVLAEVLHDLLLRGSLIALMAQSAHSAEASHAEHVLIVDALEQGDARAATRLVGRHLEMVAANLHRHPRVRDLGQALQPLAQVENIAAKPRAASARARAGTRKASK